MTDQTPTETTLADMTGVSRNEQMAAELTAVIHPVCVAYQMLAKAGMPAANAAAIASAYGFNVVERHFGILADQYAAFDVEGDE